MDYHTEDMWLIHGIKYCKDNAYPQASPIPLDLVQQCNDTKHI